MPRTRPIPLPIIMLFQSQPSLDVEGVALVITRVVVVVVLGGSGLIAGGNPAVICVVSVGCPPGVNNIGALMVWTDTEKIAELVDEMPFVTADVRALALVLAREL
mmetsp:Transcript_98941/g.196180  ORF Transcript_98941/g.196180 Transcript_98941/m.196180 type:complete len:105 (-) Transcript_98941:466-780(-)